MNKKLLAVFLTLSMLFPMHSFAADYKGHWAQDYIEKAFSDKIAYENENSDFYPDRKITRAEFITLLVNHMLKYEHIKSTSLFTSFSDIKTDAPYFPHIVIAEENGIISGYSDGSFRPDSFLTREDAVVFVCRAYKINPPSDEFSKNYSDSEDISSYAKKYLQFAVNRNILVGYTNNTLRPKNHVSRAEALVILDKFKGTSIKQAPEFMPEYPKISPVGTVNNITLEIKTTAPCTIFFKAVKKESLLSYITPKKEEITNILAVISDADTLVKSDILLNSYNEDYVIFLMPVSDDGTVGTIKRIKDIKALAYENGDGSKSNPYIIYNENQLNHMRYCQDNHFKLANDIVLSYDWTPINASGGFFGSLDGDGHTIYGLRVSSSSNAGLFSHLKGGEIKNLHINGSVKAGSNAGLFAGILEDGIISGCAATGEVSASSSNAGGIVGTNKGEIINSLSACHSVNAAVNSGGISGNNVGKISLCVCAVNEVTADMYAGSCSGINQGEISSVVGANMLTKSQFTYSSGRISFNKDDGYTHNNYAYEDMNTSLINQNSDKNSHNGQELSWNDIISHEFYTSNIDSSFFENWRLSSTSNFVLPVPNAFSDITYTPGITPYAPEKIFSPERLLSLEKDKHYILSCDISLKKAPSVSDFCGSFDGSNHTIYNLNGCLFSSVSDGQIRNLRLKNTKNAAIADTNGGRIENCRIDGTKSVKDTSPSGTIANINNGNIINCDSTADITVLADSSTVGGIVGHNEGFVDSCSYSGNITISRTDNSLSSSGGICGFNNEGFIYNCSSFAKINVNSSSSYTGGICGILASGEIFKCSSGGTLKILSDAAYSGGICALSSSGLIHSCFSALNINSESSSAYTGGICGYNSASSIQNTYSVNTLYQSDNKKSDEKVFFTGGICSFNENGFISDNAAINPWIISAGEKFGICSSPEEYLSNNYTYSPFAENEVYSPQNGTAVTKKDIFSKEFFFKPVHQGGRLGWSHTSYDASAVWTNSKGAYSFPVLNGVKEQNSFINPVEFR